MEIDYSGLKEAGASRQLLDYVEGVFHKIDPWKPIWIYRFDTDKMAQDKNISQEDRDWLTNHFRKRDKEII